MKKSLAPQTEAELLERALALKGLSLGQLAGQLSLSIPTESLKRKGFVGMAVEKALGADAANLAIPDFRHLGVELKTLPLGLEGKPLESTFVTSIHLLNIHKEIWKNSQCYSKLKRVLWLPLEGDRDIPYAQRRLGEAFLWSPSLAEEAILEGDWTHLVSEIALGNLESISARMGEALQIRPKAANGKVLVDALDARGEKIKTLPRGFYLRALFTAGLR